MNYCTVCREDWIVRGNSSSFWVPRNLTTHMIRQAHTGDTVLVKGREMTGRTQKHCHVAGGEGIKTTENKIHRRRWQCWNFKQSMGDRNRLGIGLSHRSARLHSLAESVSWNRFLGSLKVKKFGLCVEGKGRLDVHCYYLAELLCTNTQHAPPA